MEEFNIEGKVVGTSTGEDGQEYDVHRLSALYNGKEYQLSEHEVVRENGQSYVTLVFVPVNDKSMDDIVADMDIVFVGAHLDGQLKGCYTSGEGVEVKVNADAHAAKTIKSLQEVYFPPRSDFESALKPSDN